MKMSRGLRNNNPLNIRRNATRWEGLAAEQKDSAFFSFVAPCWGYRAAFITLKNYKRLHGLATLAEWVARWAPPVENDTQAYIRTVLRLTSLGGKENLPQPSRGVDIPRLERLLAAMTTVECGLPYPQVDTQAIREGFDLAFPGKRSYARTQPPSETFDTEAMEELLMWDEYRDWA